MSISSRIIDLNKELKESTRLLAVSKTKTNEQIMQAYAVGQRCFGENKVQELVLKYQELPKDIEWHMIGHLQTNKVKYIAPFIDTIHSIDSLKLLKMINNEAYKQSRIIKVMFEIYIAAEEAKFGLSAIEAEEIIKSGELENLNNLKLVGLMGMASFTDDSSQIEVEFATIKNCFDNLKSKYFANDEAFRELSIGMSSDYKIAIKHGSTLIRLGSTIFGER